jgi:hypothetical protein
MYVIEISIFLSNLYRILVFSINISSRFLLGNSHKLVLVTGRGTIAEHERLLTRFWNYIYCRHV